MKDELFQRIQDSFARQGFMNTLKARLADVTEGQVSIAAPISEAVSQQHGFAHAGIAFSIGDSAAGYSALTLFDPEVEVVTAEMKVNLVSPAKGQSLLAVGKVIKPGRRLCVVTADVFAIDKGEQKLIAVMQGTMVPVGYRG